MAATVQKIRATLESRALCSYFVLNVSAKPIYDSPIHYRLSTFFPKINQIKNVRLIARKAFISQKRLQGRLEDSFMVMWPAQSIQAVWFVSSVEGLRGDALYEQLTGEEPNSVERNKIPSPVNPFFSVSSGAYGAYNAMLQVQPGRVDFVLTPRVNLTEEQEMGVQTVDAKIMLAQTFKAISRFDPVMLPSLRLAINANLLKTMPDLAVAGSEVLAKIGYDPGFDDFSDLLFQINRRTKSDENPLLFLNRVLRYSVVAYQSFSFTMLNGGGAPAAPVPIATEQFSASLSIDVNTVPDGNPIAAAAQISIFEEIIRNISSLGNEGSVKSLVD